MPLSREYTGGTCVGRCSMKCPTCRVEGPPLRALRARGARASLRRSGTDAGRVADGASGLPVLEGGQESSAHVGD